MPLQSALIALALMGADAPPPDAPVATEVRIAEMKGTAWRGQLHARLNLVAQQHGATIWTADRETVAALTALASTVTETPKVVSEPMTEAVINAGTSRRYVARLGRIADGAVNRATAVAYEPHVSSIEDGCRLRIAGRAIDQGVLARVGIEDTRFEGFTTVVCPETVQPRQKGGQPHRIASQYQVPEVHTATVRGEWLIPKDGALIVSTGVHSRDPGADKAPVCERVFVIEARSAAAPAMDADFQAGVGAGLLDSELRHHTVAGMLADRRILVLPAGGRLDVSITPTAVPAIPIAGLLSTEPVALAPSTIPAHAGGSRPMPTLPSRALPRGVSPDGTPAPPPPLPDAETASYEEESDDAHPSPQARPGATRPVAIPTDVAVQAGPRQPGALLFALPIGPLMGEIRYRAGQPQRFAIGLRLGSANVGKVVDEAVTRTSAEMPDASPRPAAPLGPACAAPKEASAARRSIAIEVKTEAHPVPTTGRPVRVELPLGASTIHVEIRAAQTQKSPMKP